MKKPKISEGEWTYFNTTVQTEHKHVAYCRTSQSPLAYDEQYANAKAISAVPDMIDALIEARKSLLQYIHSHTTPESSYQKALKSISNIEQALKKAGVTDD